MKKKGFTLIELLVVIAIIAMLLAILMPALGKVKRLAERLVCGTNLKGMGTAQATYAFDYDDEFAIQGGKTNRVWSDRTDGWTNFPNPIDWSNSGDTTGMTVGASLYLLVREADVDPKSFVCRSSGETAYEGEQPVGNNLDLVDLWDFGSWSFEGTGPQNCVSYSYQQPYSVGGYAAHPASGSSTASMAIMADKNPWYDSSLTHGSFDVTTWQGVVALLALKSNGDVDKDLNGREKVGNSNAHSREGQNVLFGDGHVDWTKVATVGMEEDNIYTNWLGDPAIGGDKSIESRKIGFGPVALGSGVARADADSVLANDDQEGGFQ